MPLTLATLGAEIVARVGGKMAQAGLSAATDGTNPDLLPPIRKGLRYVGRVPADPIAVTNTDLALVPAKVVETYLDACILETLYAVQGRFLNGYDQQVQDEKQSLHQIMTDTAAMIADYQGRVPKLNTGRTSVGSLAAGSVVPGDIFRPYPLGGGTAPNPYTFPYPS